MIKIENTEVMGWGHAIRGMRNPMNSWEKSDSGYCRQDLLRDCTTCVHGYNCWKEGFDIGPNDYSLMMKLAKSGTDHRKFMRMIVVYLDITAPLYWWKEFDTYKVGTVANSCSTMHKIGAKEFTRDDFSCEHLFSIEQTRLMEWAVEVDYDLRITKESVKNSNAVLDNIINSLNYYRGLYLTYKNMEFNDESAKAFMLKDIWWQMIQLLPTSYNQRRTVMLNYEVLANIYKSRKNHKLDEWREFCRWIESLPYSEIITGEEE